VKHGDKSISECRIQIPHWKIIKKSLQRLHPESFHIIQIPHWKIIKPELLKIFSSRYVNSNSSLEDNQDYDEMSYEEREKLIQIPHWKIIKHFGVEPVMVNSAHSNSSLEDNQGRLSGIDAHAAD